jgi:saccharopine dehydrogenase-like NADP-dependent oxidoreductase
LVASPPAIVARWLAQGKVKAKGVLPPERAVEAEPFFRALAERGARTTTSIAEPYPAA